MSKTDIFISYKREEYEKAEQIAQILKSEGYSVWWDIDILPGEQFADAIEKVIDDAKVALVLWSNQSIQSRWVLAEAKRAWDKNILISVNLDGCNLPMPYNVDQAVNLVGSIEPEEANFQGLLASIRQRIGEPDHSEEQSQHIEDQENQAKLEAEDWRAISENPHQSMKEYRHYIEKWGEAARWKDLAEIRIANLQDMAHKQKKDSHKALTWMKIGALIPALALLFVVFQFVYEEWNSWRKADPIEPRQESVTPIKPPQEAASLAFTKLLKEDHLVYACANLAAPKNSIPNLNIGSAFETLKQHASQAMRYCTSALERHPDHPELQFLLGRSFHADEQYTEAFLRYEKACHKHNGSAGACFNLGVMYANGEGGLPKD